jgi:hypothetical protein
MFSEMALSFAMVTIHCPSKAFLFDFLPIKKHHDCESRGVVEVDGLGFSAQEGHRRHHACRHRHGSVGDGS